MGPAIPCGIPYTAAATYSDRHSLDTDDLYRLIQAMDGTYLDWWAAKAKEDAGNRE